MAGPISAPTVQAAPWAQAPSPQRPPPLENGDRLTRVEFERRYEAMPQVKKAELIEGVVYMPSPVSIKHSEPHAHAIGWLSYYRAATPNVRAGGSGTVRLDMQNEFQPDVSLLIEPECGGQTRVSKEGYVEGAPELVVEVARSSVGIDLHDKLRVYLRNGVREYIVWRVDDGALDWFVLREGRYEPLAPAADGICRSEVFPGLWLDSAALLRGDFAAVRKAAEQGLASPEHAQFAARLQEAAAKAAQK